MIGKHLRPAIVLTLLLCALTGLLYPAVVTAIAQLVFPRQANGSLVSVGGRTVGSELIGQSFTASYYFHGRPSAAGVGYDAAASGGTNKGPTDRKLADTLITGAVEQVVKDDGAEKGKIPSDLVTASASGLDPHISPASAALQIPRVARERSASPDAVGKLVEAHTEGRQFGFLGDPRVNVLMLNIALDSAFPRPAAK